MQDQEAREILEDVFLKLTADDGVPAEPSAARGEKEEDEAE